MHAAIATVDPAGSKDGLVKLWCPRSGRNLSTLHGHKGTIMQAGIVQHCEVVPRSLACGRRLAPGVWLRAERWVGC